MRIYVLGSFPPKVYLPLAVTWTAGGTAACVLTDHRLAGWLPDLGTLATAVTLLVTLLMMRAVDDIRDREHDRRHNPDRPLARGAVAVRDLGVLIGACVVLVLALNSWRWPVACLLAGLLGYAFVVLWLDQRFGWPAGDAMMIGLLVNVPVQLLVNTFLYAAVLYPAGLAPSWAAAAGVVATTLAFLHIEFARKTTRAPAPGERTYVRVLGTTGTAAMAVGCAAGSAALLVVTAQPWNAAVLLVLVPLVSPAAAALQFRRGRPRRWPYPLAALFVLSMYATVFLVAVVRQLVSP